MNGDRVEHRRESDVEARQPQARRSERGDPTDNLGRAGLADLDADGRAAALVDILGAISIAATFHGTVASTLLAGWVGLLGLAVIARMATARYVARCGRYPQQSTLTLCTLAIITAGIWGATPWLFVDAGLGPKAFIVLLLLGAVAAAAVPYMAGMWRAYLGFLVALLAPACVWLFTWSTPTASLLGASMLVYTLALLLAARAHTRGLRQSHELAAELARANVQVGQANEQLRTQADESQRAQAALTRSERRFQAAFEHAPVGMALVTRDGRVFQANTTLAQLLGHAGETLNGRYLTDYVVAEDAHDFARTIETLAGGSSDSAPLEMRFSTAAGSTLWASLAVGALEDSDGVRYFIVEIQDITESIELSARLRYEADHDPLTGLINRRALVRRLEPRLPGSATAQKHHALAYLELERFKLINDVQGHIAGDEVLRQVAGLLEEQIGEHDTLARLRGDEFAVLFEDCDTATAYIRLRAMVRAIAECRFFWRERVFRLDLSAGLVSLNADHFGVDEVIRAAETACAAAKETGGGRVHTYQPDDTELQRIEGRLTWVNRITEALERGRFTLYGQPIVASRAPQHRSSLHLEILVRMRDHHTGEPFAPGAFMEAAERYGLAKRLDRWVVRGVFDWFRRHPEAVDRVASCAINLSGSSLEDPEFTQTLMRELRHAPLAPQQVRFEVTETAAIGHLAQARQFMERIESLGCRFALDDFGSGLSSFGYLRALPVDSLKIDGQFVRDIVDDGVDRELVRSIHAVGRSLGLETVAEFVENAATLEVLDEIGVDFVQGHYIGAAQPLERLFEERHLPIVSS